MNKYEKEKEKKKKKGEKNGFLNIVCLSGCWLV